MDAKNLSARELAAAVGVAPITINRLLNGSGSGTSKGTAGKIAEKLECEVADIFDDTDARSLKVRSAPGRSPKRRRPSSSSPSVCDIHRIEKSVTGVCETCELEA